MTENIQDLIEKINQDGVIAAKQKADEIEEQAHKKAQDIISSASINAQNMLDEAKEKIEKLSQKQKELIAQAGRDMLIMIRREINNMLAKIIISEVDKSLTHEAMFKIISWLIKEYKGKDHDDIVIELDKSDSAIIEKTFFSKLKEETKKGIILRASGDIKGGFIISFDSNKSHYDFSDRSLAEYIGRFLKPKLNDILNS